MSENISKIFQPQRSQLEAESGFLFGSRKSYVEQQLRENPINVILSHTCPFKYEPAEMFLAGIDQSTVDASTERWLDQIEESADYVAWFCGHWHTDKRIDKMHFLFHSFESEEHIGLSEDEKVKRIYQAAA